MHQKGRVIRALKYSLWVSGVLAGVALLHQASCRIAPPSNSFVAKKAYEFSEEGRGGYETFEEFVNAGVSVKSGSHNKVTGVREFDVYFMVKDPKRTDSIGEIELIKFNMTSCGRVLDAKKMTIGAL